MERISIRPEEAGDHSGVYDLNLQAFETDDEAKLVDALRGAAEPVISLVAVEEKRVVGHILFTPVTVDKAPDGALMMGLGPMAVLPELQRRGIGSKLVHAGLDACRALRVDVVFVLGYADYYPRFGFEPAPPLGLRFKSEEFDPFFMVLALKPGILDSTSGYIHYRREFDEV